MRLSDPLYGSYGVFVLFALLLLEFMFPFAFEFLFLFLLLLPELVFVLVLESVFVFAFSLVVVDIVVAFVFAPPVLELFEFLEHALKKKIAASMTRIAKVCCISVFSSARMVELLEL